MAAAGPSGAHAPHLPDPAMSHVAETDAKAREQAEPHLATAAFRKPSPPARAGTSSAPPGWLRPQRNAGDDPGTPERAELRRTFRERAHSYDFWVDNGIALVGSPETVVRQLQEQHKLIGHDIFCARHMFGYMDPGAVRNSIRLFAEEVMPASPETQASHECPRMNFRGPVIQSGKFVPIRR